MKKCNSIAIKAHDYQHLHINLKVVFFRKGENQRKLRSLLSDKQRYTSFIKTINYFVTLQIPHLYLIKIEKIQLLYKMQLQSLSQNMNQKIINYLVRVRSMPKVKSMIYGCKKSLSATEIHTNNQTLPLDKFIRAKKS